MNSIAQHAHEIVAQTISAVLPDEAVKRALAAQQPPENVTLIAIGKAAWRMAKAAHDVWGDHITHGVVITKYGHAQGEIGALEIYEAAHPVLDANGIAATKSALAATANLTAGNTVLFLVSGGGSALFEAPAPGISLQMLADVNEQLLRSGADIVEVNTVRKRLSTVKGGRFAQHVAPARIKTLVLSDVIGDRLDSIASGPAHPDPTTAADAAAIVEKYGLSMPDTVQAALARETPKRLENVESTIVGSVQVAVNAAAKAARALGYTPIVLTTTLDCEAREAGRLLASIAREVRESGQPLKPPCAVIMGGETVVQVRGSGLGGRNQELALAAAIALDGLSDIVVASVGTDGTDGPCDAAGGVVDGTTVATMRAAGVDAQASLANNDAYWGLNSAESLLITGPTGTNVNDVCFALIR